MIVVRAGFWRGGGGTTCIYLHQGSWLKSITLEWPSCATRHIIWVGAFLLRVFFALFGILASGCVGSSFLKECQRLEYISGWQPAILPLAQICEALCGDQHNMHCLANKDGQPATESKQALFVRGNLPTCRYQANKEDFPALSSCVELFPIQQVIW